MSAVEEYRAHRLFRMFGSTDLPPDDEVNGDYADAAIVELTTTIAELEAENIDLLCAVNHEEDKVAKLNWMLLESITLTTQELASHYGVSWAGEDADEVLENLLRRWEART